MDSYDGETLAERVEIILIGLKFGEEAKLDLYMPRLKRKSTPSSARSVISTTAHRLDVNYYTRLRDGDLYIGRIP